MKLPILASIAMSLVIACCANADAAEHAPYLPLAKITISAPAQEAQDFGDSFFHATNFQRSDEVVIIAYSHEPESAWRPTWDRLWRLLSTKFPTISGDQH
jgi:hypothetical protein